MEPLPAGVALLAAGIAVVTDLRQRKIHNWLTLPLPLVGAGVQFGLHGWSGVVHSLAGLALVTALLALIVLLAGPGMGGGDIKLLMGLAAVLGWPQAGWMLVFTCAGGLVVVPLLVRRKLLGTVFRNLALNLLRRKAGECEISLASGSCAPALPYAVCILIGTLAAILRSPS